jgi:small multidrug resistance family-3 protein
VSRTHSTASINSASTPTPHDRPLDRPVHRAALAEIGGAYLVWVGLRDDKGPLVVALGIIALGLYGVVATLQPENEFGRVLAAYGGVFIVGSIAWGMAFDSFRPDRYDLTGAAICLVGVAVIMYAPR